MIEIDANFIKEIEKTLGRYKSKTPIVLYRALNRAASTTKTAATKKVRGKYHIKSRDIKNTMDTIKANKSRLGAIVISRGNHIPLDKFRYKPKNPRPKNPPNSLQVAVKRDGYKDLKSAFVSDISGNKIFKRVGAERLPIRRLAGPATPQMLSNEKVQSYVNEEATETFFKRLDHEVKRVLERGK